MKNTEQKPELIPEDLYLRRQCQLYLSFDDLIDHEPPPRMVRKLMQWYLANVPARKPSGQELATSVDFMAANRQWTARRAIEFVSEFVGMSVDAVAQAHKRHGQPKAKLDKLRDAAKVRQSSDDTDSIEELFSDSPEHLAREEEARRQYETLENKWAQYRALRRELWAWDEKDKSD